MDNINSVDDVKNFFRFLYMEKNLAFHPDESFDCYVSLGDDRPIFTVSECEKYDRLMDECFNVCELAGVDIYETATEIRDSMSLPFGNTN